MQDRTGQLIDRAIGIGAAACGIGLSLKIVGWVAGVHDLDPVGTWLCLPAGLGLLTSMPALCIGSWPAIRLVLAALAKHLKVGFRGNTVP